MNLFGLKQLADSSPLLNEIAAVYCQMPTDWGARDVPSGCVERVRRSIRRSIRAETGVVYACIAGDDVLTGFVWAVCSRSRAHVKGLWVRADKRRSGMGSHLLQAAEKWARAKGATDITAHVHYLNAVMLLVAFKLDYVPGFVDIGKPLD